MAVVGIKFKTDGKVYNFSSDLELVKDQKVIVETERGEQLGIVENPNVDTLNTKNLKEIKGLATEKDYNNYLNNLKATKSIVAETKELIQKMNLNMNLIDATYSLDRKQLLFNFISDERVDFRELVKELASKYHARIELHQVGVRDKAKEIGGLGLCGRVLCCKNHLKDMSTVNINMVKNQDIALNPTKINGACGRLLCCFNYENDIYEDFRKDLPKIGQKIQKNGKTGTITKIDILKKKYVLKYDENDFEEVQVEDGM